MLRAASIRSKGLLPFVLSLMLLAGLGAPGLAAAAAPRLDFAALPLHFEQNLGQTDPRVRFLARGEGYTLFLTRDEAVLSLRGASGMGRGVVRMRLAGGVPSPQLAGSDELAGKTHYLRGATRGGWHTGIPNFERVQYQGVYPGVDLVYYGVRQRIEFDFVVAPGADPEAIALEFEGADALALDPDGGLVLRVGGGELTLPAPTIYQERDGERSPVAGGYMLRGERSVGFELAAHDESRTLVIDPELVYSTYLRGSQNDRAYGIALDAAGNAYVTGGTESSNFPTTVGVLQHDLAGDDRDAFVTVVDPTGSALVYSTYLGGSGNFDEARSIAIDAMGNAWIAGLTYSNDFPLTKDAFQSTPDPPTGGFYCYPFDEDTCGDAFVAKLDPTGSQLLYSTLLGGVGHDYGGGIAVDSAGAAYVTGLTESTTSGPFPTTPGALQTTSASSLEERAFVTKFDSGGAVVYSTYLGDDDGGGEVGAGIAVDASGNAYATGYAVPGSPAPNATFVAKLNAAGSALVYSTLIDEAFFVFFPYDEASGGIALDGDGNAYVVGRAKAEFAPTPGGFDQTGEAGDYFMAKLNDDGSQILYATFLPGHNFNTGAGGIAVDAEGNAYVTASGDDTPALAVKEPVQEGYGGNIFDAFLVKIDPSKAGDDSLVYATYLGGTERDWGRGVAVDENGTACVTGATFSSDFPVTEGAFQTGGSGGGAFVACIGEADDHLLYDEVTLTAPPVFPMSPLLAPQHILPQFLLSDAQAVQRFTFEGRTTDGTVAVRALNTQMGPAPLTLEIKVFDTFGAELTPFTLFNLGSGNAGVQFEVNQDGPYTIEVRQQDGASGTFPAPFQIHLAGDVGLPRKLVNEVPEVARAIRLDTLFNHPAARRQVLGGGADEVAQTSLFKFATPTQISQFANAVLIAPAGGGFAIGGAPFITRADDPAVLGQLSGGAVDRSTPTARTPECLLPEPGSVIDFTQVPDPASVDEADPSAALTGSVCAVIGVANGLGVSLPLGGGTASLILDMGSGQEIVDGEGADFRIIALEGSYGVAVGNTPFAPDLLPIAGTFSGAQEFDLAATGLGSARYVRVDAAPSVGLDSVKALNVFADANLGGVGPVNQVSEATMTMRRAKAPVSPLDPFLQLIGPDGTLFAEADSGFGDTLSQDLSDAALVSIDLTRTGFFRFLGKGYDKVPDGQAFGAFFARLETPGDYDATPVPVSDMDEVDLSAQREGMISAARERDSYVFQASPGQGVNLVVNGIGSPALPNALLELYDPEGFLITANDDFTGRGRNAALSMTLPALSPNGDEGLPNPSTYRVVVSAIDVAGGSPIPLDEGFAHLRQAAGGRYELKLFTGALAVPEPDSVLMTLGALGALGLLARRSGGLQLPHARHTRPLPR